MLKLRAHLNFSQSELGKQLNISQARVYLYENGREIPARLVWAMVNLAKSVNLDLPFEKFYSCDISNIKDNKIDPHKELEIKFKCAELNLKIKDAIIEEQRNIIKDMAKH